MIGIVDLERIKFRFFNYQPIFFLTYTLIIMIWNYFGQHLMMMYIPLILLIIVMNYYINSLIIKKL